MGLLETFRTAIESLLSNRLRAALTMLGVIIGTMAVVLLLALGEGITGYFNAQFATFGSNQITISSDGSVANARLTNNDVKALRESVGSVKRIVPQVSGNLNAVVGTNSKSFSINGTTPDNFPMRTITFREGQSFTAEDNTRRTRNVVLGYQTAKIGRAHV